MTITEEPQGSHPPSLRIDVEDHPRPTSENDGTIEIIPPITDASGRLSESAKQRLASAAKARWGQYSADRKSGETKSDPQMAVATVSAPGGGIQISGTVEGVRRWVDLAGKFERAKTACQVMAGFELIELRRTSGFLHGGDRKSVHKAEGTWEEFVKAEFSISSDTARAWIKMAEAIRPRLKKLPGLGDLLAEIVDLPISQLDADKQQLLSDAVHKLADGKSQMEFMWDLGIAKLPQGHAAKGGDMGGEKKPAEPPSDEAMRKMAREDWVAIADRLFIQKESFTLLEDGQVESLFDFMDRMSAAMKKWVRTPKSGRDQALIVEIRESLR